MDCVREQRHGASHRHDDELRQRREHQRDERHLHSTDAALARLQRAVDRVSSVVAVRAEKIRDRPTDATTMLMLMPMLMPMPMPMLMVVLVVVVMMFRGLVTVLVGSVGGVHAVRLFV